MAAIDDLRASRDNVAARILQITAQPKPSYDIDGQAVRHAEYLQILMDTYTKLDRQIADDDGPFELDTFIFT